MHKFLRSIGFEKLKTLQDQDILLQDVLSHSDYKKVVCDEDGHTFAEISREFAPNMGITVFGEYDEENLFHMEYYYPYFWGSQISSYEKTSVDRHYAQESYAAACDDMRIGTTLIFYLANIGEYIDMRQNKIFQDIPTSVSLSGLADKGAILMPVVKEQKALAEDPKVIEYKNSLYQAAQNGDQEAIESLTMDDVDTFNMLNKRIQTEDIYTIVDSYFMPFGMECDLYSVMGDITDYSIEKNRMTGEKVVRLSMVCNEIPLDICINEEDLIGEIEIGRRFKGNIWLQGRINF